MRRMRKDSRLFEENKETIKTQIETLIEDMVVDLSFAYYESKPENWRMYGGEDILKMLFEEGERYFLVYYKSKKNEGWLCSTTYAIVDSSNFSVIEIFSANDEG